MMLKRLKIENFRSYAHEDIALPSGTNLFEGDIGSGKSSILYAIEFALFGIGDMRGESLLKAGKEQGFVELVFDIDGKEYKIRRSLARKGDSIAQSEGYLVVGNQKIDLSPSDLRAKVLELLNFNENLRTRSSSVIFRYAIFTPQEEMKEILRLKAEERLQTLRKAFGLEDYKTAKDNSKLVSDELRTRIKFIEGELSDLEEIVNQKDDNAKSIDLFAAKMESMNAKKVSIETELASAAEEVKSLESLRLSAEKTASEIPLLESELAGKKRDLVFIIEENESTAKDMESLEKRIDSLLKAEKPVISKEEIQKQSEMARKEVESRTITMIEIMTKIKNLRELMEKKICPTCERPLQITEYQHRISSMDSDYQKIKEHIKELKEKSEGLQNSMKKLEEFERAQADSKMISADLDKLRLRLEKNNDKMSSLTGRIIVLEEEIPEKKSMAAESKIVIEKLSRLEKQKTDIEDRLKQIISETSLLGGRIKALAEANERLEKQITEKLGQRKRKELLTQYHLWLNEYFVPCIDKIEKQVLASINYEFNSLFQKWFSMLLDGSEINVRIDESFTPVVEQNGYEMLIDSLSGGEKTSIAFSYRLALNMMVRKVCTSMKSNLLILDEPTDGFSKEQLFKVRDVLNELKCDQVILVSHERELESFVDKIFYVEKKGGVSSISE